MFNEHAAGAIAVERAAQGLLRRVRTRASTTVAATRPSHPPTSPNELPARHRLRSGSFPEALGAVLPCYWIYWEVGKALVERGSPDPLYPRWIDTYGGEEFAAVVRAVLELTDRLGPASRTPRPPA